MEQCVLATLEDVRYQIILQIEMQTVEDVLKYVDLHLKQMKKNHLHSHLRDLNMG